MCQNIATAEGLGFRLGKTKPRQGRKIFQARPSFAPAGAMSGCECKRDSAQPSKNERLRMQARQRAAIKNWVSAINAVHGLQPWLRSGAASRLKFVTTLHAFIACPGSG